MKLLAALIFIVLLSGCITGKTVVDSCSSCKSNISALESQINEKENSINDLIVEIAGLQEKIEGLENMYLPKYEIANFSFSQNGPISFRVVNTGSVKLYNLIFYLTSDNNNFVFNCGSSWVCEGGCTQNKNAKLIIDELNVNSSRLVLCNSVINLTSVKLLNSTLDIIEE